MENNQKSACNAGHSKFTHSSTESLKRMKKTRMAVIIGIALALLVFTAIMVFLGANDHMTWGLITLFTVAGLPVSDEIEKIDRELKRRK